MVGQQFRRPAMMTTGKTGKKIRDQTANIVHFFEIG